MTTQNKQEAGERTQKLPKGATLLARTLGKKTGGWVEQEFDAKGKWFGITWLRVKNGMGGRGDREDWVADIPAISIAVHDYHWNGEEFGANHGSFLGAIKGEMKFALNCAVGDEKELIAKLRNKKAGMVMLRNSISKAEGK